MTEKQAEYRTITDETNAALEMMGAGYGEPAIEYAKVKNMAGRLYLEIWLSDGRHVSYYIDEILKLVEAGK